MLTLWLKVITQYLQNKKIEIIFHSPVLKQLIQPGGGQRFCYINWSALSIGISTTEKNCIEEADQLLTGHLLYLMP